MELCEERVAVVGHCFAPKITPGPTITGIRKRRVVFQGSGRSTFMASGGQPDAPEVEPAEVLHVGWRQRTRVRVTTRAALAKVVLAGLGERRERRRLVLLDVRGESSPRSGKPTPSPCDRCRRRSRAVPVDRRCSGRRSSRCEGHRGLRRAPPRAAGCRYWCDATAVPIPRGGASASRTTCARRSAPSRETSRRRAPAPRREPGRVAG